MANVSRPLLLLLLGTVAVFGVYFFAFKPKSSGTAASSSGGVPYSSAIAQAHAAVAISAAASARHSETTPPATPTGTGKSAPGAAAVSQAAAAAAPPLTAKRTPTRTLGHVARPFSPHSAKQREAVVIRALSARRVVALLFYNPSGADDQAVRQELAAVPLHGGRVVKLAVPLSELARYSVITTQVQVSGSPTLVVVNRRRAASTLVGFADRFEISQMVDAALAA